MLRITHTATNFVLQHPQIALFYKGLTLFVFVVFPPSYSASYLLLLVISIRGAGRYSRRDTFVFWEGTLARRARTQQTIQHRASHLFTERGLFENVIMGVNPNPIYRTGLF